MDHRWIRLVMAWSLCGVAACGSDFEAEEPVDEPPCGNGVIDEGEICDSSNLGGNDCTSIGGSYTSGVLGCNASCDGWGTASCVEGEGSLEGEVSAAGSLGCSPDDGATDCQGAVWILVLEDDPATNLAQTPIASAMLPSVDLSQGQRAGYSVPSIPEGRWYVTAFMDDDDNASSVMPGPDAGDPISYPATAIDIEPDGVAVLDVTLTISMP